MGIHKLEQKRLPTLPIGSKTITELLSKVKHAHYRDTVHLIFEKNICISELVTILVCDMFYHARKINSFTRKGQFNEDKLGKI